MRDLQHGLLEVIAALGSHETLRAKHVTLSTKLIDEKGKPVLPDPSGPWEIIPYTGAADDFGV